MAKNKTPQIVKEIQDNPPEPVNFAFEKNVSYSQLSMYTQCPKKWALNYRDGHKVREQSIHMTFGTAIDVMYNESTAAANRINLEEDFEVRLRECYAKAYKSNSNLHFSTPEQIREFYDDGIEIISYIKKNKGKYFSKRGWSLVGCEIPIVLAPNPRLPRVKYMGFLDVVLYHEDTNKFIIIDIKTSTNGWNANAKKDKSKQHQLVLYKKFFAKQYNVPIDMTEKEFESYKNFVIKRVQQFQPPSGKTSVNRATASLKVFLDNCFTKDGFNDKEMIATINNNCKWCPFHKTHLCPATS